MCPEDLERVLGQLRDQELLHRVRMIYVVSYFDNPSGVNLAADRRRKILDAAVRWSDQHRILILEDAAYRELDYAGSSLPSLLSLDPDQKHVILTQTFSKSFAPGIRVGFGVLPGELVKAVCDLKGNDDFGS
ncbi:MAG: aminotransferase class I/II-fold pyridoxal phosphate-dependent enzyme, partial [Phycisphaerae bacterium]